jgi:hypothetical protein
MDRLISLRTKLVVFIGIALPIIIAAVLAVAAFAVEAAPRCKYC